MRSMHPVYRIIRFCVWLFSPKYKVMGLENLPDGPGVVVGNHAQMHGPISVELYFPEEHYTWCISEMMEKDKVASYAYKDFWSGKPRWIRPFYRLLSHLIPPLSVLIFTNAHTIPVYRDRRIMRTFQLSSEKLEENARVVIFPEDYTEYNNIVHRFQRGFVHIAKYHYRKTGTALPFVPLYVCPALKLLVIGKPVLYDPAAGTEEEAERICGYLQDEISEMAFRLPEHRVTPYPNIPRRYHPRNERGQSERESVIPRNDRPCDERGRKVTERER